MDSQLVTYGYTTARYTYGITYDIVKNNLNSTILQAY